MIESEDGVESMLSQGNSTSPSNDNQLEWNDLLMGYVVSENENYFVIVRPMLVNDRVIEIEKDEQFFGKRYWCYPRGGAAFLAAKVWEQDDQTEPIGWIKSWDERYTNPGIGQRGADWKMRRSV
mgnify:CR=1 FL=1